MAFSHRLATLAAVVAIPLGIAATSYALTDAPRAPKVPEGVELTTGPTTTAPTAPSPSPSSGTPRPPTGASPTGDTVVPGPSATGDDDDDRDDRDDLGESPGSRTGDDGK